MSTQSKPGLDIFDALTHDTFTTNSSQDYILQPETETEITAWQDDHWNTDLTPPRMMNR